MPAAKLALEDVNGDKNLLPGFKLILHSNDSEVRGIWRGISYVANITNLLLLTSDRLIEATDVSERTTTTNN